MLREDAPVRAGFARVRKGSATPRRHADAPLRVAADCEIDASVVLFEHTLDQRDVRFLDAALSESLAEFRMCGVILGDQDDAGGVFVQPMNDPGTDRVAALRERLAAAEQRVDQRAASVPGARMNRHARGFVDNDHVVVFVEDVERNGFGFGTHGRARLHFNSDALAATEALRAFCRPSIHQNESGGDQFLDAGTAEIGAVGGDDAIESVRGFAIGDDKVVVCRAVARIHSEILTCNSHQG